jgi:hypothetical protein
MFKRNRSGDEIRVDFKGNLSGQLAGGRNIEQRQTVSTTTVAVTPDERAALHDVLADLRAQVAAQAPPEHAARALEYVDELEQAIDADKPKVSTMAHVKDWFAQHVPALAGSVAGVVVHPVVGKLVEAAGDAVVAQFRLLLSDA